MDQWSTFRVKNKQIHSGTIRYLIDLKKITPFLNVFYKKVSIFRFVVR